MNIARSTSENSLFLDIDERKKNRYMCLAGFLSLRELHECRIFACFLGSFSESNHNTSVNMFDSLSHSQKHLTSFSRLEKSIMCGKALQNSTYVGQLHTQSLIFHISYYSNIYSKRIV